MSYRSSEEKDFILRIIRQIAESIARMREIVTNAHSGAAAEGVRAEVNQNIGMLLGNDAALLNSLDAPSAVQLLNDAERVRIWADLLDLEADAIGPNQDNAEAVTLRERAGALRSAAGITTGATPSNPRPRS